MKKQIVNLYNKDAELAEELASISANKFSKFYADIVQAHIGLVFLSPNCQQVKITILAPNEVNVGFYGEMFQLSFNMFECSSNLADDVKDKITKDWQTFLSNNLGKAYDDELAAFVKDNEEETAWLNFLANDEI